MYPRSAAAGGDICITYRHLRGRTSAEDKAAENEDMDRCSQDSLIRISRQVKDLKAE